MNRALYDKGVERHLLVFIYLLCCRCATTTRTVTVRLTGGLLSVTRWVLEAVWTAAPSDSQVN